MGNINKCPVCLSNSFKTLIDFGKVPRSDFFLSNPEEKFSEISLCFEFCENCALIRRKEFEEAEADYTEVSRATSRQLPVYAPEIINSLVKRANKDGFVIEVGANDGTFLDVLKKNSFDNLLGIEPSIACSEIAKSKGHKIETVHLNKEESLKIKERYGKAEVVICRHVLEHVSEPFELLVSIRNLLKDNGILLIEVPNSLQIINHLYGHELWEEHLHHFSPENLKMIVQRAGFKVEKSLIVSHLDSSNIVLWATKKELGIELEEEIKNKNSNQEKDVEACFMFPERWKDFCESLRLKIKNSAKPIVAIGASHPQTDFLIFTGIGDFADFLIDDDKNKAGKYAPLSKSKLIPIISTAEIIENEKPGTILRIAFGYCKWMDKICENSKEAEIIEPFKNK